MKQLFKPFCNLKMGPVVSVKNHFRNSTCLKILASTGVVRIV
jgi:hypothetical protein